MKPKFTPPEIEAAKEIMKHMETKDVGAAYKVWQANPTLHSKLPKLKIIFWVWLKVLKRIEEW